MKGARSNETELTYCLNPRPPTAPIRAWAAPIPPLPGPEAATTLNANVSHRTHPPGRLPRPKIPHHGRTHPLPPGRRTRQAARRPDLRADPGSHRRPHLRDPRPARPGRRPRRRHRSHPDPQASRRTLAARSRSHRSSSAPSSSSIRSDRWAPGAPRSHSGRFPAPPPTGASPQS